MVTTRRGTNTAGRSTFSARVQRRMQNARRMIPRTWIKRYRPTDPHHRHRIDDEQPKTQRVTTYTRRA